MTQTYKNTTPTSCVYDAFSMAGLPTTPEMMIGVTTEKVLSTLKKHGYRVALKNESPVKISGNHFFIIRDFMSDYSHIEYHESVEEILDIDPSSIGAVIFMEEKS